MTPVNVTATAGPLPDERISCTAAYPILGLLSQQSFNHIRRRLQRVWDRDSGVPTPYPDFERQFPDARTRAAREREFCDTHILVVPEWGGIKYPKGPWTYSRRRCEGIRDNAVAGLAV